MRSGELAGFFGTLRVALILLSLAGVVYLLPRLPPHTWVACVTLSLIYVWWVYNVFDVLAVATYATFVSRFPAHPLRTIALTIFSVFQIATAYSLPYAVAADCFSPVLPQNMIAPLYFSCVTIATVGYGDFHPDTRSWPLQLIAITEIFTGLFVLAVLIGVVIGWANDPPRGPRARPGIQDLLNSGVVTPWPVPKPETPNG